ncbi:MAG: hypothetical protein JXR61_12315 [Prolixibacteraceae bacterium]|nr:hypothetical protein [Prolixibacteraceae bacterium]
MKTTMKQLTAGAILGLLLIVTNVSAEGKDVIKAASSLENIETAMELESWMIDDEIWNKSSAFYLAEISEELLTLEDWMINSETWGFQENNYTETENNFYLKLESWMTDLLIWNR